MNEDSAHISQLLEKLETLINKQKDFSKEIDALRVEIVRLKISEIKASGPLPKTTLDHIEPTIHPELQEESANNEDETSIEEESSVMPFTPEDHLPPSKLKLDLEKFIGENLISKIGILILFIGMVIGVKYSIENDLISPLTRIILGYIMGIGLLGIGIKLKENYLNFSAVLVSGAIAIMYFISFAAYDFYALIPQVFAFALMVIFTAFTILAALTYNKQVIALFGAVGAYAVPFLLSSGSGDALVLFSYVAIINIGVLFIAFRKYWKPLYYSSFIISWLIFFAWFVFSFEDKEHFMLALIFQSIFFATFYITFLAYKLGKSEKFSYFDICFILANSFIFYGLGYTTLEGHQDAEELLGLFTLGNAVIHFLVSWIIYKRQLADKNLFYLISGLVLIFLTIAIPVQLDGNWVSLLWVGEAALLFWIGKSKNILVYERLSYPLMILAFFSINQDWAQAYMMSPWESEKAIIKPLLNIHFLTSVLFIGSFMVMAYINYAKNESLPPNAGKWYNKLGNFVIPAILLYAVYFSFHMEINSYWNQVYINSALPLNGNITPFNASMHNDDVLKFKDIWLINYSLLFFSLLALLNIKKLKHHLLGWVNIGFLVLAILTLLLRGVFILRDLRHSYLDQSLAEYYQQDGFNVGIRYICFAFIGLALYASYSYSKQKFTKGKLNKAFDFLFHFTLLFIVSSEIVNWMEIAMSSQSFKLGLSITWGIYALILIALGIWKNKKHLRIGAIVLFGVTLLKLFLYDISDLNTIAKTIVFVSLGILLLIISFLYNKFKHLIFDET